MAAVGSAVGLGNIFRFPALTASYGIWFIVFYVIALFTVGLSLLYAELSFGREKSKGAGGLPVAEIPCVINCFLVLCCYLVFFALVMRQAISALFSVKPDLIFLIFAALTAFFCFGSAEKLSKICEVGIIFSVAVLFVLAAAGIFKNPEGLRAKVGTEELFSAGFFEAVFGQVFFSLSLSVGVMTAYGSMLDRKIPLFKSAVAVCLCDFGVSLLSTAVYLCLNGNRGLTTDGLFSYPEIFSDFFGNTVGRAATFFFFLGLSLLCLNSVIAYLKAISVFSPNQSKTASRLLAAALSVGFFLSLNGYSLLSLADRKILPAVGLFAGAAESFFLMRRTTRLPFFFALFVPLTLSLVLIIKIFI